MDTDKRTVYEFGDFILESGRRRLLRRQSGGPIALARHAAQHGPNLVLSIALAGICGSLLVPGARSNAEAIGERTGELDVIVVTARKREERSQDVPISIIALSGNQLERSHAYLPVEIVQSIPNMQLQFINPRQAAFSIRGLGNNPANEGLETSVGLYLDGVYISRPGMLTSDLDDIEQITVLRGPQGTLFGRNTTAGALSISTRKPERTFKSDVEFSAGSFGLTQSRGSVTGPLSSTLSGRLSAFYTGRDGTVENIVTGSALNNQNKIGARAQIYFEPGDALNLRLIADFSHQQENSGAQVLVNPGLTLANGSTRPNNVLVRTARFGYTPIFDPFARRVNIDRRQAIGTTNTGTSLEANLHFGGYTLTSISAWRRWEFFPSNDMDYLPLDIQQTGGSNLWNRQLSEEIRIASPIHRSMDFVAGVFIYGQRLETATIPGATYGADAAKFYSQPTLILPAYALEGLTSYTHAEADTDSDAIFGQIAWHVDDKWDLTAGGRSNWDHKVAVVSRRRSGGSVLNPADPYFAAATAARNQLAPGNATADSRSSGNTLSGSLSLSYRPTDALLLYGSHSRGVKAAGVNTNILPAAVNPVIKPEVVKAIELGVKSSFLNHRLEINGDLFWANIDNYQTTVRDRVLTASYLANAESARTRGAELEIRWAVLHGLQADAAVAYDEATYTSFHSAPCGAEWTGIATSCDLTGRPVSGAPGWSGAVQVEYSRGLARNLQSTGGIEYTFRSSSYYSSDDSAYSLIDGYGLVNIHLNMGSPSERWQIALWVRNVLDKEYFAALSSLGGVFGSGYVAGIIGDPRTYGATLRLEF
jgi:iron complex outermembrane receptor protein